MTSHETIDLSLARETYPNMSDKISRSIASAVSQAVQRTVDEALSRLPTSASSTSSATSISTMSLTSASQEVCTYARLDYHCICLDTRLVLNTEYIRPFSFF